MCFSTLSFSECPNDLVCTSCGESGHKRGECKMVPSSESESEESEAESDLESKATDSEAPNDETTTKADECHVKHVVLIVMRNKVSLVVTCLRCPLTNS